MYYIANRVTNYKPSPHKYKLFSPKKYAEDNPSLWSEFIKEHFPFSNSLEDVTEKWITYIQKIDPFTYKIKVIWEEGKSNPTPNILIEDIPISTIKKILGTAQQMQELIKIIESGEQQEK